MPLCTTAARPRWGATCSKGWCAKAVWRRAAAVRLRVWALVRASIRAMFSLLVTLVHRTVSSMSLMMPYWHFRGKQNSTGEAYTVKPTDFLARTEKFVASNRVGTFKNPIPNALVAEVPIAEPPAGGDAYLIGRADLAVSCGVDDIRHPSVQRAVDHTVQACLAAHKTVGIFVGSPDEIPLWADASVRLFIVGSDQVIEGSELMVRMIDEAVDEAVGTNQETISRLVGDGTDVRFDKLVPGAERLVERVAARVRERLLRRDLAGIDGEDPVVVDDRREAVHPARRGAVLGAGRLDAEPVVARPVAGAFHPVVLDAGVRLAAEVRAALVERANVERGPVAGLVVAGDELLAARVDQDDEGTGVRVVGREALVERDRAVLGLHVRVLRERDLPAEAAREDDDAAAILPGHRQRWSVMPVGRRWNEMRSWARKPRSARAIVSSSPAW